MKNINRMKITGANIRRRSILVKALKNWDLKTLREINPLKHTASFKRCMSYALELRRSSRQKIAA